MCVCVNETGGGMGGRDGIWMWGWRLEWICHTSVDAGKLLKEHGHGRDNDTAEHGPGLEQGPDGDPLQLEDVPGREGDEVGPLRGRRALLEHALGFDLEELELDELVVRREPAQGAEHVAGFGLAVVVDEPAGGEGHEQHADAEGDAGEELQADGDEPGRVRLGGSCAADVVRAVVDPEGDHDPCGDGQLLEGHERAPDFGGSHFGVVVGHVDGHGAHGETGDEAASQEGLSAGCGDGHALNDHTDDEEPDVQHNGVFAREDLGQKAGIETATPGAEFEDGGEPAFLVLVDDPFAHV